MWINLFSVASISATRELSSVQQFCFSHAYLLRKDHRLTGRPTSKANKKEIVVILQTSLEYLMTHQAPCRAVLALF